MKLLGTLAAVAAALVAQGHAATTVYKMSDTVFQGQARHGVWLSNFFKGGSAPSSQYWSLDAAQSTLTVDDVAKTAVISAVVSNVYDDNGTLTTNSELSFQVDMAFTLLEGSGRPGGPFCQTINKPNPCDGLHAGMAYYEMGDASFTGLNALAGIDATLTDRGLNPRHPFQFGLGGDAFNAAVLGGSSWMNVDWNQNTDVSVMVNNLTYNLNTDQNSMHGDINFAAMELPDIGEVPIPGAALLFGSALAGFVARRKRNA